MSSLNGLWNAIATLPEFNTRIAQPVVYVPRLDIEARSISSSSLIDPSITSLPSDFETPTVSVLERNPRLASPVVHTPRQPLEEGDHWLWRAIKRFIGLGEVPETIQTTNSVPAPEHAAGPRSWGPVAVVPQFSNGARR